MFELKDKIEKELGIVLSENDIKKVILKFGGIDKNYDIIYEKCIKSMEKYEDNERGNGENLNHSCLSHENILKLIRDKIELRTKTAGSTQNNIRNAFVLLSDGLDNRLTQMSFRRLLELRLSIFLSDEQIQEFFRRYGLDHSGSIPTKKLVGALYGSQSESKSLPLGNNRVLHQPIEGVLDSHVSSRPPRYSAAPAYERLRDVESRIRDKILSLCSAQEHFVLKAYRLFGGLEGRPDAVAGAVNRETVKTVLRTKLRLVLRDDELALLWEKYDRDRGGSGCGHVSIPALVRGIGATAETYVPLVDKMLSQPPTSPRPSTNTRVRLLGYSDAEPSPSVYFRLSMIERVRHGQSAHALVKDCGNMSRDEFVSFVSRHFECVPSDALLNKVQEQFPAADGCGIDARKLFKAALSTSLFKQQEVREVDSPRGQYRGPASSQSEFRSSDQTLHMLRHKLQERFVGKQPTQAQIVALLFHAQSSVQPSESSRDRLNDVVDDTFLHNLLRSFNISMNEADFRKFVESLSGGAAVGLGRVRDLIRRLFPEESHTDNPLYPKSAAEYRLHQAVVQQLSVLTKEKRTVQALTGVSAQRLQAPVVGNGHGHGDGVQAHIEAVGDKVPPPSPSRPQPQAFPDKDVEAPAVAAESDVAQAQGVLGAALARPPSPRAPHTTPSSASLRRARRHVTLRGPTDSHGQCAVAVSGCATDEDSLHTGSMEITEPSKQGHGAASTKVVERPRSANRVRRVTIGTVLTATASRARPRSAPSCRHSARVEFTALQPQPQSQQQPPSNNDDDDECLGSTRAQAGARNVYRRRPASASTAGMPHRGGQASSSSEHPTSSIQSSSSSLSAEDALEAPSVTPDQWTVPAPVPIPPSAEPRRFLRTRGGARLVVRGSSLLRRSKKVSVPSKGVSPFDMLTRIKCELLRKYTATEQEEYGLFIKAVQRSLPSRPT